MTDNKAIGKALLEAEFGRNEEEAVTLFKASLKKNGFLVLPRSTEGMMPDANIR